MNLRPINTEKIIADQLAPAFVYEFSAQPGQWHAVQFFGSYEGKYLTASDVERGKGTIFSAKNNVIVRDSGVEGSVGIMVNSNLAVGDLVFFKPSGTRAILQIEFSAIQAESLTVNGEGRFYAEYSQFGTFNESGGIFRGYVQLFVVD